MNITINNKLVSADRKESFFRKLKKDGDCLIFDGAKTKDGYGWIGINGRQMTAHRFAYMLEFGVINDPKILVCHKCDNPPCCNPEHLFVGTDNDNIQDMIRKGRKAVLKGDDHPNSLLKEADARQILTSNLPSKVLAKIFSVSRFTIYDIKARRSWKHL